MSTRIEDGIAIVGMAGRFPGAPDIDAFWHNLKRGVESIRRFTQAELEIAPPPDAGAAFVPARGVIDGVDLFDAEFFGVQPREAQYTDPQHRLLLETAWEALENSGHDPAQFDGSVGVFAGCSQNTYLLHHLAATPGFLAEYLSAQQLGAHPALLGNDKDFLATRLSYKLNLRGPSVSVQTACSTSLVAVCQACQSLLNFQCDLALAGGVSLTFPQRRGYVYEEGSIVSKDGRCRPFDAAADGTVFGDGVGLVVLKRADEALRDRDPIYAVIRGFGVNNDGADKVSYMAPSVEGQCGAVAAAHALAGIDVQTIRYVEAHGTGTALGDPIEVAALTRAFRLGTEARQFCTLGASKGNIGHLEAAAGVAGLIKAALAVYHGEIPPTLHFTAPNPQIDFASTPFSVGAELKPWPDLIAPRRAGVSSFGVGGTNAHLVLEQAPPATRLTHPPVARLLILSARSAAALDAQRIRLAEHLALHPQADLGDIAFTLQKGRRAFRQRLAAVAATANEAAEILGAKKGLVLGDAGGRRTGVAFLFPGQGAQQAEMGRDLYENDPIFRREVEHCCAIAGPELQVDLREVLYPRNGSGNAATLTQTALTQPALFVVEYALAQVWFARGVKPHLLVGHSLGEYVAAVLSGIFSLEDALHLLAVRGRLMQALPPGAMLAVALAESELAPLLGGEMSLAAVNGPRSCVVSGPPAAALAFGQQLVARGVVGRELKTSHAFHSAMMDPILAEFAEAVEKVRRRPPQIPLVSTRLGRLATDAEWTDPAYWSGQLREPVRFSDALGTALAMDDLVFLEVGPGFTLSALARQQVGWRPTHVMTSSLARKPGESDTAAMLEATGRLWTAGVEIAWSALRKDGEPRRVALPTYPFERRRHWIEPEPPGEAASAPVAQFSASPTDIPGRSAAPPTAPADVEKLIEEQLRIMTKQIEVLRSASASAPVGEGSS